METVLARDYPCPAGLLLTALDRTFDERRENFQLLFGNLNAALVSERDDAGVQLSEILSAVTELARTSSFSDLKSPALVVQEVSSGRKGNRTLRVAVGSLTSLEILWASLFTFYVSPCRPPSSSSQHS